MFVELGNLDSILIINIFNKTRYINYFENFTNFQTMKIIFLSFAYVYS